MNYAKIKNFDIANGPGLRVSLFVSGCRFRCKGCFNQETWDYSYGNEFTSDVESHLLKLLANEHIEGLSILGGDPLWQDDKGLTTLTSLCEKTRTLSKNVWLWSGFTFDSIVKYGSPSQLNLLNSVDVMIDGQFVLEKRDIRLKYKGSSNQRIIDVQESLKQNQVVLKHQ